MKGLVLAGTHSGAGKTTISLALMAALRRRGMIVQPFKVGPDFIDPGHHAQVTGRPSHNLDGWMLSREENLAIFRRYASGADVAVVEGVMGLFDGYDGQSEAGSTAQMAKWLNLPVLLCVDARSMARSLAALALGFARFDPELDFAGLLANRVGSPRHVQYLSQAMELVPDLEFWGGLSRNADIAMPERHLGLITAEERLIDENNITRLCEWLEQGLDTDRLIEALPEIKDLETGGRPPMEKTTGERVRLGVARDEAFCFYYPENLRRLEQAGAELVYFSPVHDRKLPADLDGIYLGGGYPELFARGLSQNLSMRQGIRELGESGRPVYGECGGLMYLSLSIRDLEGETWPMTGLLPLDIVMLDKLKSLGYRAITFTEDTPLGPAGLSARGHEFHYSEIKGPEGYDSVFAALDRDGRSGRSPGFLKDSVLASYVHLHFGSNSRLAENLIASCRKNKKGF